MASATIRAIGYAVAPDSPCFANMDMREGVVFFAPDDGAAPSTRRWGVPIFRGAHAGPQVGAEAGLCAMGRWVSTGTAPPFFAVVPKDHSEGGSEPQRRFSAGSELGTALNSRAPL